MRIDINIEWNLFEQEVHRATSRTVRAVAAEVLAEASKGILDVAPHIRRRKAGGKWTRETVTDLIDTGALQASGYIVTGGGHDERGAAIAAANGHQPGVEIGVPPERPRTDLEAQCNYAAGYAGPVEALYPFLAPGAERASRKVEAIAKRELEKEGL